MPFQTALGKLFYRVGDVIISTNSENPSKWYGGTWELFAPGRTLVCIDTSQSEFNAVKKTGGSKFLQSHTHGASSASGGSHNHSGSTGNAGNHNHLFRIAGNIYKYSGGNAICAINGSSAYRLANNSGNFDKHDGCIESSGSHAHTITINSGGSHSHSITVNSTGSGNAQNLQPFITVYMWIRIT
ncbi:phage baseplate protein [Longibaculum muris]|uniref:phage baseplate protein n=1 Tax=Longibaculum muris TaxID=1796628 RepID=UPI00204B6BD3|nr:hypothetical protein [Longibaculum muris]DAZ60255.1 MAG TPA: LONG TAIL FIBER PROTEIN [Caudoviricetes sp.]